MKTEDGKSTSGEVKSKADEVAEKKYETMYDYVRSWDITHYRQTGRYQGDVLIVEFKPVDDHDFVVDDDGRKYMGYVRVNSGETEVSYLKEDALDEECYILYRWDGKDGHEQYFSNGIVYDTEESAEHAKLELIGGTEGDVANQLLSFVQNIDSEEDAFEFARIFIDAMESANNTEYSRNCIYQNVAESDERFLHVVCPRCSDELHYDPEAHTYKCVHCNYEIEFYSDNQ